MSCFVPFLRSWTILGTPEFKSGACPLPNITTTFADLFSESMRTILRAIPLSHADCTSKTSSRLSLGVLSAPLLTFPFPAVCVHRSWGQRSSFTFSKPYVEILFTNSLGMLRAYILMPFPWQISTRVSNTRRESPIFFCIRSFPTFPPPKFCRRCNHPDIFGMVAGTSP